MKQFLFLCFLGASTLSIGQTQETPPQEPVQPQAIQSQKYSKVNKINKRVKVQRPAVEQPKKKEEDSRQ
jgi:hypothetical protein